MNRTQALATLVALHALTGISSAQQQDAGTREKAGNAAYSERITEDELIKLRSQSQAITGSSPEETVSGPAASSFADSSDFISFNGLTTFVPKGAVLHIPDGMRKCMVAGIHGELVFWGDFLRRFPTIVEPLEVTIQEAAGVKLIEPNRLATAMRSERIIVTVIGGNPTSVCQPENITSK